MEKYIIVPAIILLLIGSGLIALLIKLLKKPLKWAFKLALHAAFGFIFLFIFNFVGAWADLSLEINWINCLLAGALGVPGVIALLILQYIA